MSSISKAAATLGSSEPSPEGYAASSERESSLGLPGVPGYQSEESEGWTSAEDEPENDSSLGPWLTPRWKRTASTGPVPWQHANVHRAASDKRKQRQGKGSRQRQEARRRLLKREAAPRKVPRAAGDTGEAPGAVMAAAWAPVVLDPRSAWAAGPPKERLPAEEELCEGLKECDLLAAEVPPVVAPRLIHEPEEKVQEQTPGQPAEDAEQLCQLLLQELTAGA